MSGLFGTFNIAKSGLFAQQEALNVTSHNIANASTDGYTRQKVNLVTTTPENSLGAGQIGTGVQVASITRVKDDFLDYQTRVENGTQGLYTSKNQFLSQVESVINEPSDTGISSLIGKFYNSFQQLSKSPSDSASKQVVAQQSLALTDELNHTYNELDTIKTNAQSTINSTVTDVNSLLSQISSINQQIVQVNVSGQQPNDLLDSRDKLLNELSSDLGMNVDKTNFDGINVTTNVSSGGTVNLVQAVMPDAARTLSYVDTIAKTVANSDGTSQYTVTYYKKGDKTDAANKMTIYVNLTDAEAKTLDQGRVLLADKDGKALIGGTNDGSASGNPTSFSNLTLLETKTGSLEGYSEVQNDVSGYMDQLNQFAKALAFSVNAVETQNSDADSTNSVNADGAYKDATGAVAYNFFVNNDPVSTNTVGANENAITAGNITLNSVIENDPSKIITGVSNDPTVSGVDDGTRALAIAGLQSSLLDVQDITSSSTRKKFLSSTLEPTSTDLFTNDSTLGIKIVKNNTNGVTTDSYFNNLVDNLGIKEQKAQRMVQNQTTLLASFQQSKDSVSGVSLDEEMANLVQYQHAYQANAKIISTIDELLDVVINGLKK